MSGCQETRAETPQAVSSDAPWGADMPDYTDDDWQQQVADADPDPANLNLAAYHLNLAREHLAEANRRKT